MDNHEKTVETKAAGDRLNKARVIFAKLMLACVMVWLALIIFYFVSGYMAVLTHNSFFEDISIVFSGIFVIAMLVSATILALAGMALATMTLVRSKISAERILSILQLSSVAVGTTSALLAIFNPAGSISLEVSFAAVGVIILVLVVTVISSIILAWKVTRHNAATGTLNSDSAVN